MEKYIRWKCDKEQVGVRTSWEWEQERGNLKITRSLGIFKMRKISKFGKIRNLNFILFDITIKIATKQISSYINPKWIRNKLEKSVFKALSCFQKWLFNVQKHNNQTLKITKQKKFTWPFVNTHPTPKVSRIIWMALTSS